MMWLIRSITVIYFIYYLAFIEVELWHQRREIVVVYRNSVTVSVMWSRNKENIDISSGCKIVSYPVESLVSFKDEQDGGSGMPRNRQGR